MQLKFSFGILTNSGENREKWEYLSMTKDQLKDFMNFLKI